MNDGAALSGRHAIVTGAGYIGSALIRRLRSEGCRVSVLGRRRPAGLGGADRYCEWQIGEPVPDGVLDGADWLFHLAHDWSADTADADSSLNVTGFRLLLASARAAGVARIVYAGSQQAETGGPLSRYGAVKRACERLLIGADEISVRIGFVCGGAWGGPGRKLLSVLRRTPVIPVPASGAAIQPVHVDDVAAALVRVAADGWVSAEPPALAGSDRLTFGAFVCAVAEARFGHVVRPVPVPRTVLAGLARVLRGTLRERVAGLVTIQPMAARVPQGVPFRSLDAILAPDRRRRADRLMSREAWALFTRMSAVRPPHSLVRDYRNALQAEGLAPVGLPRGRLACGIALRWNELVRRDIALCDRLGFALALIERHPMHRRLLLGRRRGIVMRLRTATGMAVDVLLGLVGKPQS